MIYDICIIGGGASGLTAAIAAGRAGASVLIAESLPKTGKKILVTGNGHCNLSNRLIRRANLEKLMADDSYRLEKPEFAVRVLSAFDADDTEAFFKSIGLMVHEKGNLVYPMSDQAAAVARRFRQDHQARARPQRQDMVHHGHRPKQQQRRHYQLLHPHTATGGQ